MLSSTDQKIDIIIQKLAVVQETLEKQHETILLVSQTQCHI